MNDLIKQCDECKLNECINCEHSWVDIQKLKQQLTEKDKEIEKLRTIMIAECPEDFTIKINGVKFSHEQYIALITTNSLIDYNWKDREKQIRHQVCDEIRKSFDEHRKILRSNYDECIFSMDDIIEELEELDQIEKGETQC